MLDIIAMPNAADDQIYCIHNDALLELLQNCLRENNQCGHLRSIRLLLVRGSLTIFYSFIFHVDLNLLRHDLRVRVGSLSRFKLTLPQCNVSDVLNCMSGRLSRFSSLY